MKTIFLFLALLASQLIHAQEEVLGKINITLYWDQATAKDTLYFFVINPIHTSQNLITLKEIPHDGKYAFVVPVADSSGFFKIKTKATFTDDGSAKAKYANIVATQFWRIGDEVSIHINNHKETALGAYNDCNFTGKDALRYTLFRKTDSLLLSDDIIREPKDYFENPQQRVLDHAMEHLNEFKNVLSDQDYKLIASNISYYNGSYVYMEYYDRYLKLGNKRVKQEFVNQYKINHAKISANEDGSPLINSNLIKYLFNKYRFESRLEKDGLIDFETMFRKIVNNEHGAIRDRLIAEVFFKIRKPANFAIIQNEAAALVKEKYSKDFVDHFSRQTSGKKFDDMSFLDEADKEVRISDFKGKVSVIDIWSIGCGACHVLYRDVISKLKNKYSKSEVAFISLGIDRKKHRWLSGVESGLFTTKEGINLTTGTQGYDHPLFINYEITGTPTIIILNQDGIIEAFNSQDLYTLDGMTKVLDKILH